MEFLSYTELLHSIQVNEKIFPPYSDFRGQLLDIVVFVGLQYFFFRMPKKRCNVAVHVKSSYLSGAVWKKKLMTGGSSLEAVRVATTWKSP